MSTDRLISGWVNPLAFLEVDEPWALMTKATPTLESVLRFLCPANERLDIETIVARYREISTEPVRLFLAPAEQRLLDKLVWPLRHAKASYMVGNYLATIALCGMVAEMVALLLWEIADPQINARPMSKEDEKALFGSEFERLGQGRRVGVLSAYNIVAPDVRQHFEQILLRGMLRSQCILSGQEDTMKLHVVLEPSEEGGFAAIVPSLPGCISEGDTREEALANIQEAIQLYLEPVDDDAALSPDVEVVEIAV